MVGQFPCNLEDSFDAPHIISEVMTSDILTSDKIITNQVGVIPIILTLLYYSMAWNYFNNLFNKSYQKQRDI